MSYISPEEIHYKREKEKARILRKSRWWHNKAFTSNCYYCEKKMIREEVTMDHRIPISRGGMSTKGNVVPACKECNNQKKNLTPIEWDAFINGKLKQS